ncbi:RNase A-like domain-containing protein [Streptomyces roseus]|uniref:Bacterial CdiA-CT RNAse A domain-containing protein n=1 Tax=Streptomyces roseus TaxID=66430 RepID=A0A0J7AQC2_9ACTN|nr:RNase A-like domain-containing protein [Streptomyces roseus]KMO99436.1 hypothetical protein ACS04_01925 [Streptomyces roseus]
MPALVTFAFQHDAGRLLSVEVAGSGTLSTTPGHKFFVVGRGWTVAADLRMGDQLREPDSSVRLVTSLSELGMPSPLRVHDITVDGLHSFFVRTSGAGPRDVLVHNCLNLRLHEGDRGAHTIRDHVDLTPQKAVAKAKKDLEDHPNTSRGESSLWTDFDTAQQSVDAAFRKWHSSEAHRKQLQKWMQKTPVDSDSAAHLLSITVRLDTPGSLGKIYKANGDVRDAGNTVTIVLKRSAHKGYMVYTAYPVD